MSEIKYPFLPEGKEITLVPLENPFMTRARTVARNMSTDRKHPTGAVVVKDGVILGEGANQVPLKNKTLSKMHQKGACVRKLFKVKSGEKYWICPGCANYSDHGEQQAVRNAIAQSGDVQGADLYLWGHWWCCEPCWNAMLAVGIENVYLLEGGDTLFDRDNPANKIGKFEEIA